jgi:hypothetical protein
MGLIAWQQERDFFLVPKAFISKKWTRFDTSDFIIIPYCYNLRFSPGVRGLQGTTLLFEPQRTIFNGPWLECGYWILKKKILDEIRAQ